MGNRLEDIRADIEKTQKEFENPNETNPDRLNELMKRLRRLMYEFKQLDIREKR